MSPSIRTLAIYTSVCALVVATAIPAASSTSKQAAKSKSAEDITGLPGYVDFGLLKAFHDQDPRVEVNLKGPLLQLASQFVDDEDDPGLKQVIAKVKSVRVFVYDVSDGLEKIAGTVAEKTAKELDARGWERVVRVRDEGDNVTVLVKPSNNYEWIAGLVAMIISDDDEAVFVNVAGKIHPADVARLGKHFDVDLGNIDLKH